MNKFTKKAVTIEAVQFLAGNFDEIEEFVGGDAEFRDGELIIATLEGPLRAAPNDWIIKGIKGEFYPCKPDIFEATYDQAGSGFDFGIALCHLKSGEKVARKGWNGKGMWVALTPASSFEAAYAKYGHAARHRAVELVEGRAEINLLPHIDMRTADGSMVVGWLASQTDMLADDWCIIS